MGLGLVLIVAAFSSWAEDSPTRLGDTVYLAISDHARGDNAAALVKLDQALTRRPDDMVARRYRGLALQGLGRYADAMVDHEFVLARQPRSRVALTGLCRSRMLAGKAAQSRAACEAALQSGGELVDHMNLAHSALQSGDLAAARSHYQIALWMTDTDEELPKTASADLDAFIAKGLKADAARAMRDWIQVQWQQLADLRELKHRIDTLRESVQLQEAVVASREAKALVQARVGTEHPEFVRRLSEEAWLLTRWSHEEEALSGARQTLALAEKVLPADSIGLAYYIRQLAAALQDLRQHAEALTLFERAQRITEQVEGEESIATAEALSRTANHLLLMQSYGKAQSMFERALAIGERLEGPDGTSLRRPLGGLATLYLRTDRAAVALPLMERAARLTEQAFGERAAQTSSAWTTLASTLQMLKRYDEAAQWHRRALAVCEAVRGTESPYCANIMSNLSRVLMAQDKPEDALSLAERSVSIGEKTMPPDDPQLAMYVRTLAWAYSKLGKYSLAKQAVKRAEAIEGRARASARRPQP